LKEFFEGVPIITHQGCYETHPFAFKFYDPERVVAGRPMREHFRFALPVGVLERFGLSGADGLLATMELLHKLGISYYTLTDKALGGEGGSLRESNARLDDMAEIMLTLQNTFQVRPLRLAADFTHPRYCYGAGTSYSADVYAFAAAQLKKSLELARKLGALHFCFFSGQETRAGFYMSVNDTLESENLARLLQHLRDYANSLGYNGKLCVRPAVPEDVSPPAEPYWPTAAHALAFLRHAGLSADYWIDAEPGSSSELRMLLQTERLGLLELRTLDGGALVPLLSRAQLELQRAGGLFGGTVLQISPAACATPEDYFIHCVMYMDACACGLLLAQRLLLDGRVEQFRRERYGSFGFGVGRAVLENQADFSTLEQHALQKGEARALTARAEYLENVFQSMLFRGF
jgi:xylose isomerase